MKYISLITFTFTFTQLTAQQQFQRLYNGDLNLYGYGIVQRSDGGYASCGAWQKALGTEGYLLQTDAAGDFQSMMRYGIANGTIQLNDIEQTSDGGYIMCGYIDTGTLFSHALIMKTNSSGSITWSEVIGGGISDDFKQVVLTSDGGYFAIGITQSYGNGGSDVLAVKLSPTGSVEWAKAAGTGSQDAAYGAIQASDDGYAISGRTFNAIPQMQGGGPRSNNDNLFMLRLDEQGDRMWGYATGGYGSDAGDDVIQLGTGPFVFSGTTEDYGGRTGYNAILIGVQPDGSHSWTKTYDFDSSYNQGYDMIYNPKEIAVIGSTDKDSADGASPVNPMLFKTNEAGDLQWCQLYGEPVDPDEEFDLRRTSDLGYVMTGYSSGFGSAYGDEYFIKTDGNGVSGCHEQAITLTVIDTALDYGDVGDSVIDIPSIHHFSYAIGEEPHTPWDTTLCLLTGIALTGEQSEIEVYPNPASEAFVISIPESQGVVLEVFDVIGRQILSQRANSHLTITVSGWSTGVYLVRAISEGRTIGIGKLIVE